jgi:hypothetical protein
VLPGEALRTPGCVADTALELLLWLIVGQALDVLQAIQRGAGVGDTIAVAFTGTAHGFGRSLRLPCQVSELRRCLLPGQALQASHHFFQLFGKCPLAAAAAGRVGIERCAAFQAFNLLLLAAGQFLELLEGFVELLGALLPVAPLDALVLVAQLVH